MEQERQTLPFLYPQELRQYFELLERESKALFAKSQIAMQVAQRQPED
jgi:hypothetical protein